MKGVPPHVLEATRLMREGRLAEAQALLRGGAAGATAAPTPPPGARFEDLSGAGRPAKLYVPSAPLRAGAALVVMLHGCTQTPDDFATGTRMNLHAEEFGFLALYPGQVETANPQRCWNWFNAGEQSREGTEPALLAALARTVAQAHGIEPGRIFVAGLSAGGALAANLGVLYPDVFAAIGVHSGLACGAASDMQSAFAAMQQGAPRVSPSTRPIRAIVFHGDADRTVNLANSDQVIAQAQAGARHPETVETGTAGGRAFTRTLRLGPDGGVALERWISHGGGHAWFGGDPRGSYADPQGPDASREMVRFFLAPRAR